MNLRPSGAVADPDNEPLWINGDELHGAVVYDDDGRWTCRLCGRQAMHADGTHGYGVMHSDRCYLVTAGVIRNRNRRGVCHA